MRVLTAEQAAEVDRRSIEEFGVPGVVLMETAGRALARVVEHPYSRRAKRGVIVLCGPGNNGGDGLVAARVLHVHGLRVEVFLLGSAAKLKGEARHNLQMLHLAGLELTEMDDDLHAFEAALQRGGICIDALFGIGLARPVEGTAASAIDLVNRSTVRVIAMDIPSGVNGTTGAVLGTAIDADATVTAGFLKRGLLLYPGAARCGRLYVAEIGFPAAAMPTLDTTLITPTDVASWLPRRDPTINKGKAGRLTIVAGSQGMTGAAMLTTRGALRSGAGLVTLCLPATLHGNLHNAPLEALTRAIPDEGRGIFGRASREALGEGEHGAWAIGPGIGRAAETLEVIAEVLDATAERPCVLDADGLRALPRATARAKDRVVTPHPGEMSTLMERPLDEVLADPITIARDCARKFGVTALLKGAHTVIAAPDGRVRINPTGNPGMASGGMGDTLTGIIGALLAQGLGGFEAAAAGAFIHGRAADRHAAAQGERGLLAHDVADGIPATIAEVLSRPVAVPFVVEC